MNIREMKNHLNILYIQREEKGVTPLLERQIRTLENDIYGLRQREYVHCSYLSENEYRERLSYLEKSREAMRQSHNYSKH